MRQKPELYASKALFCLEMACDTLRECFSVKSDDERNKIILTVLSILRDVSADVKYELGGKTIEQMRELHDSK